ncbi:MAG: redox-sensing transcriptional repressor Rex [Christensenellales bacterium]|jgi:redox-sensing transcriptional repressor
MGKVVSRQTLKRLPLYVKYLCALPQETYHISATAIAQDLGLNDVQVRKDLASISSGGKPKVGYVTQQLIQEIQSFLGYGNDDKAVIVGSGSEVGLMFLFPCSFEEIGLEIAAFFLPDDADKTGMAEHKALPMHKLPSLCRRMEVRIGILATGPENAQQICDIMVQSGIQAIWNFAPVILNTPAHVLVLNENMEASLAILSGHVKQLRERADEIAMEG